MHRHLLFLRLEDGVFLLPKQSQKSRSIIKDGSRSLGLFRKGKTCIIAKFHSADLIICNHSREGKTPSYSQINAVYALLFLDQQYFPSLLA